MNDTSASRSAEYKNPSHVRGSSSRVLREADNPDPAECE